MVGGSGEHRHLTLGQGPAGRVPDPGGAVCAAVCGEQDKDRHGESGGPGAAAGDQLAAGNGGGQRVEALPGLVQVDARRFPGQERAGPGLARADQRGLRLNSAGTTALVDRLERLELVRRSRDTVDRRRVLLEVEEKAVRLGRSFFGSVIDDVVVVSDALEPGERETVRRFLTSALEAARRARPS